jgi:branched-chain amino acid transport system ATP-binding protein
MKVLEAQDITVSYGGLKANDGVSVEVEEGSLVGLIGPNGAGKTTFIDALTGFTPADGTILVDGERIDQLPAHRRAKKGLSRTFQSIELFDDLTVRENLLVSAERQQWWGSLADLVKPKRGAGASIEWALDLLELGALADRLPSELPQGQQKLAGVARAIVSRPRILLLDEPAAGLDSAESHALGRKLRAITEQGVSILLVDHDMSLVLDVSERIYVLEFGKLLASGTPAEIRKDKKVVAAYLGSSDEDAPAETAGVRSKGRAR